MSHTVSLPNLGADDASVALAGWLVAIGDSVSKGDVIAELESDKTIVELESDADGTVAVFLVEPGTEGIVAGTPLLELTPAGDAPVEVAETPSTPRAKVDDGPDQGAATAAAASAEAASAAPASNADADMTTLAARMAKQSGANPKGSGPAGRVMASDFTDDGALTRILDNPSGAARLSPVARRMLEMTGQSPAAYMERANGASIGAREVGIAFGQADTVASEPSAGRPADPVDTKALEQTTAPFSFTPADGVRRAVAARLSQSKQSAPHYYMTMDMDATGLLEWRTLLNDVADKAKAPRFSVNDVLLRLVAESLKREPALNSAWTGDGVRQYERADIAVALASPRGLLTPVVRHADSMDVHAIAARVRELAEAATSGAIRSDDLYGATFTVSNLGMFGVKDFAAIVMPPQTAILAVGGIERRPMAAPAGDGTHNRPMFSCTLSVDHRSADGVEGARFLALLKELVEDPRRVLL